MDRRTFLGALGLSTLGPRLLEAESKILESLIPESDPWRHYPYLSWSGRSGRIMLNGSYISSHLILKILDHRAKAIDAQFNKYFDPTSEGFKSCMNSDPRSFCQYGPELLVETNLITCRLFLGSRSARHHNLSFLLAHQMQPRPYVHLIMKQFKHKQYTWYTPVLERT